VSNPGGSHRVNNEPVDQDIPDVFMWVTPLPSKTEAKHLGLIITRLLMGKTGSSRCEQGLAAFSWKHVLKNP
jgi:hypothetical protein